VRGLCRISAGCVVALASRPPWIPPAIAKPNWAGWASRPRTRPTPTRSWKAAEEQIGEEILTFNNAPSGDQEDPETGAAHRLDPETLCAWLPERKLAMVALAAAGPSPRQVRVPGVGLV
jgi:hypothetical protein